jgi:hypothetical protein
MVEPHQAVGLVPTMRGIRHRDEIRVSIEHLSHLIKAASWLSSMDLPVRLIAIPEGALQGFNDEVLDLDHEEFARECAIDIPGPETDALGALARQWNTFLMAQGPPSRVPWTLLQRRLHPRPGRRDHPPAPQGGAPAARRAVGDAAQRDIWRRPDKR